MKKLITKFDGMNKDKKFFNKRSVIISLYCCKCINSYILSLYVEKMFMRPLRVTNLNRLTTELQNKIQESKVPQQQAFNFLMLVYLVAAQQTLKNLKMLIKMVIW